MWRCQGGSSIPAEARSTPSTASLTHSCRYDRVVQARSNRTRRRERQRDAIETGKISSKLLFAEYSASVPIRQFREFGWRCKPFSALWHVTACNRRDSAAMGEKRRCILCCEHDKRYTAVNETAHCSWLGMSLKRDVVSYSGVRERWRGGSSPVLSPWQLALAADSTSSAAGTVSDPPRELLLSREHARASS